VRRPVSFARAELAAHLLLRAEDADAVDQVGTARRHQLDA
jgi:hypothetical protein